MASISRESLEAKCISQEESDKDAHIRSLCKSDLDDMALIVPESAVFRVSVIDSIYVLSIKKA